MMRRVAVVGDSLQNGGEILSYSGQGFTIGEARHQVALIGGQAYCAACKSTGPIAKTGGPRRLNFMGETAADGDIVLCKCPTPPKVVAVLAGETWCDDQLEDFGVVASIRSADDSDGSRGKEPAFDEQFRLVDHDTGRPLANVRYRIRTASGAGITGVTDANGHTQRIATASSEQLKIEIDHAEY